MAGYWLESMQFLLRWLHVIAAIAWIGESFYFVALDNGLKAPEPAEAAAGVAGESWSVHGGGFYRKQKYLVAPARMPATLHWSKWKAYTTWLSGFALFAALYLSQPRLMLIDPTVSQLGSGGAVALALGLLCGGWLIYDGLCRLLAGNDRLLGGAVALFVLALDLLTTRWFAGRAAFVLSGAVLATIMSANVFFVIIPGQRKLVAALSRGETPDPIDGKRGKQRSVHNTYFTLPVVFAMLSHHDASTYAQAHAGWILALWMLAGALIRQFFVLLHAGRQAWWLPLAGTLAIAAALVAMRPSPPVPATAATATAAAAGPSHSDGGAAKPTVPASIQGIVRHRCVACHSSHPTLMASAPQGLTFDDPAQLRAHAQGIYRQVVQLRVMPLGNLTGMTDDERAAIAAWYASQAD